MTPDHDHDMDAVKHMLGVGLVWFLVICLAGGVDYALSHGQQKETGLVPQGCPSGKVTIEIRMNGKLYRSFERNSLQAFDFIVPASATVVVKPERVYY